MRVLRMAFLCVISFLRGRSFYEYRFRALSQYCVGFDGLFRCLDHFRCLRGREGEAEARIEFFLDHALYIG